MDSMTRKEASEKRSVSTRQINYYYVEGCIPGAVKRAGIGLIPKNSAEPIDGRTSEGRMQK